MQLKSTISLLLGSMLLGVSSAACIDPTKLPPPTTQPGKFDASVQLGDLTPAQVLAFAPESGTCSGVECSSPEVAAKALNEAFATYGLTTLGQKAAMCAYMGLESVGFSYNINHFPGNPGQGTKSMMAFAHLYNFAASFPELKAAVAQNSPGGVIGQVNYGNAEAFVPKETKNKIRELVLGPDYTFKSGPWYLTSYAAATCDKTQLNNGYQGFVATMEAPCFYVAMDASRKDRWCKTVKALLPAGMTAPTECA